MHSISTLARKKNQHFKWKGGNEQKFMGEGQSFKGKLIGVLEVREARGDRMCQDAVQELKMAIKASGEHKQRIIIQIAVDGLKIRDEKSGDCLYHHPVHKISFIAQDMSDNRAFGYIYGSPENGHRFFGIKTEKAAGQVVVAMRDLFQVVFELKKKEIEEAKQTMDKEGGRGGASAASFPDGVMPGGDKGNQGGVDDLLGLASEISAIQAGIQQIDKITPNPPLSFQTDSMLPFSLTNNPQAVLPPLSAQLSQQQLQQPQLPPPQQQPKRPVAVMNPNPRGGEGFGTAPFLPPPPSKMGRRSDQDRYAVFDNNNQHQQLGVNMGFGQQQQQHQYGQQMQQQQQQQQQQSFQQSAFSSLDLGGGLVDSLPSIFTTPPTTSAAIGGFSSQSPSGFGSGFGQTNGGSGVFSPPANPPQPEPIQGPSSLSSLFTDLDPLGSGKSKPFVDKKDFFSGKSNGNRSMASAGGFGGATAAGTASQESLTNIPPPATQDPAYSINNNDLL